VPYGFVTEIISLNSIKWQFL